MSHTPGPWPKPEYHNGSFNEWWDIGTIAKAYTEANAHLIAAAPDLLRLLTWTVDTLRARSPEVLGMHPEGTEAAALIAKLTGEQ